MLKTEQIRKNVILGSHIVMPNHFHGRVWLTSVDPTLSELRQGFHSPSGTIGSVVRGLKAAVTKRMREATGDRIQVFQRNYFDHVIRSEEALQKIDAYILGNVALWEADRFFVSIE